MRNRNMLEQMEAKFLGSPLLLPQTLAATTLQVTHLMSSRRAFSAMVTVPLTRARKENGERNDIPAY